MSVERRSRKSSQMVAEEEESSVSKDKEDEFDMLSPNTDAGIDIQIDRNSLIKGLIFAEIFGKPKSMRFLERYRSIR